MNSTNKFPVDFLPKNIQKLLKEISSKTKSPPSIIFSAIMVAISSASQNTTTIERNKKLKSSTSLYFFDIAESGERKTTVFNLILEPIFIRQSDLEKQYIIESDDFEKQYSIWKTKEAALAKAYTKAITKHDDESGTLELLRTHQKVKPTKPVCRKLIYSDTTPEALLYGLSHNSRSATILDDEGGRFFSGPLMSSAGLLCSAWDSSDVNVERRHTDSFTVRNPRLTLAIQVQPGIFTKFLERKGDEARSSGFFARCLISCPASTIGYRLMDNKEVELYYLAYFHQRIHKLLDRTEEIILKFSPEAQQEWNTKFNHYEQMMRSGDYLSEFRDFGSKAPEKLARIAALLHLFEYDNTEISQETLISATAVMNWYTSEFTRIFGPEDPTKTIANNAEALENWLKTMTNEGRLDIPKNTILQRGPNKLRNKDRLDEAIQYLINNNKCFCIRKGNRIFVQLFYSMPGPTYIPNRYAMR